MKSTWIDSVVGVHLGKGFPHRLLRRARQRRVPASNHPVEQNLRKPVVSRNLAFIRQLSLKLSVARRGS